MEAKNKAEIEVAGDSDKRKGNSDENQSSASSSTNKID